MSEATACESGSEVSEFMEFNDWEQLFRDTREGRHKASGGEITEEEFIDLKDQLEFCKWQDTNRGVSVGASASLSRLRREYPYMF